MLTLMAESETASEKDAAGEIECHIYGDYGIRDCQLKSQMVQMRKEMALAENRNDKNKVKELLGKIDSASKLVQDLKLRKSNNEKIK